MVVSVVVHAALLTFIILVIARPRSTAESTTTTTLIQLAQEPLDADRLVDLPPLIEERVIPPESEVMPPEPEPRPAPRPAAPTDSGVAVEAVVAPVEAPAAIELDDRPTPVIADRRVIGPEYAGGRVWVQPLEAELGIVEESPDRATHAARVASAVTRLVRAYADTMPADSFAVPAPAKWTKTDDQGRTWGIDQSWLYLGDIKIPTLLLALLNLPQGNYYQAQDEANLRRIRADIMQAARRIETAESIREYVKEIRKRKDAERAALRARMAAQGAQGTSTRDTIPW
jgi:hypothetical protein